ncbi:MAG TPA: cytochrome c oxidase subunit 3 [Bryobacteraceae bacterium]|nr:cytochrome c oxidase subunit 3 [Bryobacteraceae bacterium]
MSTIALDRLPPEVASHPPLVTTLDERRGTAGMWLFILTEAALFILLFFSYFYLAQGGWRWLGEEPPKLRLAIPMLVVLWISSAVLHWGERQVKAARYSRARTGLGLTILLGVIFLVMQAFEYMDHLKTLTPRTNVYGSIFYTITTFHAAHLILGLLMLCYALALPQYEPVNHPPHRPYHNTALYWHFVDFVWFWIIIFLYIGPNIR